MNDQLKALWTQLLQLALASLLAYLMGAGGLPSPMSATPSVPIVLPRATQHENTRVIVAGIRSGLPTDKTNALASRVKGSFGGAGCTGTIIKHSDDKLYVLIAAHCVSGRGASGTIRMMDGTSLAAKVIVYNRSTDVAVLSAPLPDDAPYSIVAGVNPDKGVDVWHAGFGVDRPGSLEEGKVLGHSYSDTVLRYSMDVSSGDSGSAIFRSDDNTIVGCVTGYDRSSSIGPSVSAIRAELKKIGADPLPPGDPPRRIPRVPWFPRLPRIFR